MRRLVFLHSAWRDLADILEYITRESGSLAIGRSFTMGLGQQCAKLASRPGTFGRARSELNPDIRSFSYKGYVILFRYVGRSLEIVNVFEGHRDIEKGFSSEPDL